MGPAHRRGDGSQAGVQGIKMGRGLITKGLSLGGDFRYYSQNDEALQKEYFKWERYTV